MINWLKNLFPPQDRTFGAARSSGWGKVRAEHIRKFPNCAVCGGTRQCEVHHIRPFHLHPELELDPNNLITLCEGKETVICHLIFGHFGNYRTKYNVNIREEAEIWKQRFLAKETI